jgi:hypothetical protein
MVMVMMIRSVHGFLCITVQSFCPLLYMCVKLVAHTEGETWIEGAWKQGAEDGTWT